MKYIVVAVILAAAIGGYMFFRGSSAPAPAAPAEQKNFDNMTFVLSASFACADKTHFIAEFPQAESVQIILDGTVLRQVPKAYSTSGERYENSDWTYLFRGEGVTVTRKSNYASTTCSQPIDPNNAPVNFGD